MIEKLSKVQIQHIIAIIIIVTCSLIATYSAIWGINAKAERILDSYFNMCLVGVVGWAFTQSKNKQQ